jgi:hypothetical protein
MAFFGPPYLDETPQQLDGPPRPRSPRWESPEYSPEYLEYPDQPSPPQSNPLSYIFPWSVDIGISPGVAIDIRPRRHCSALRGVASPRSRPVHKPLDLGYREWSVSRLAIYAQPLHGGRICRLRTRHHIRPGAPLCSANAASSRARQIASHRGCGPSNCRSAGRLRRACPVVHFAHRRPPDYVADHAGRSGPLASILHSGHSCAHRPPRGPTGELSDK